MVKFVENEKENEVGLPFGEFELSEDEMNEVVEEDELKELNEDGLYTSEQVMGIINDYEDKLEDFKLDLENIEDIQVNVNEFQKGVNSISKLCGQFSALVSIGFSKEDAATLLINRETCGHNLEVSKVQSVQVEVEKEKMSI